MTDSDPSLEGRVEALREEVRALAARLDSVADQVAAISGTKAAPIQALRVEQEDAAPIVSVPEALTGRTFLSSVSALSLLLVVALVLRWIANQEILNPQIASLLGVAYASSLIAFGFLRYAKKRRAMPLYITSGILLLFSIIFETYYSFEWISTPLAYSVLGLSVVIVTAFSLLYRVAAPVSVGVLGAGVLGLALVFPSPLFPYLPVLLLLVNGASYAAGRIPRCRGLLGATFVLTLFFWLMWTARVRVPLLNGEEPSVELALPWLLPSVGAFALLYVLMALRAALRTSEGPGPFMSALPSLNVAWAYAAASVVAVPGSGWEGRVGAVGILVAVFHMALVFWLAAGDNRRPRAAASFATAAAIALLASLPAAVGSMPIAIAIWSLFALGLAVMSVFWRNGAIRAVSFFVQLYACGAALVSGSMSVVEPFSGLRAIGTAAAFGLCATHYVWCRRKAPEPHGPLWDVAEVMLLLATLGYAYGTLRMVSFASFGAGAEGVFQSSQSIVINMSALVLMLLGLRWMSGQVQFAAGMVAVAGALKVFGYDLFNIRDFPLVLSVSSFALTAAVASVVWGRWQRQTSQPGVEQDE